MANITDVLTQRITAMGVTVVKVIQMDNTVMVRCQKIRDVNKRELDKALRDIPKKINVKGVWAKGTTIGVEL